MQKLSGLLSYPSKIIRVVISGFCAGIAAACCLLFLGGPASALDLLVDDLGDLGDANLSDPLCKTSGNSCTLRAAIQQTNFTADSSNTVGFSGALPLPGTILLGSSLPVITACAFINGQGFARLTIDGQNLYSIFSIDSTTNNCLMSIADIRLIRGLASPWNGGAVSIAEGDSLSLQRVVFEDNSARSAGGALYCNYCLNISIQYSRFSRNSAPYLGGAVFAEGANIITVNHSVFEDNAGSANFNGGGAMTVFHSRLTITDSVFEGNQAFQSGGGLYFSSLNKSLSIRDSLFAGNTAGYSGGGIYLGDSSSIVLERATVSGNRAAFGGGITMGDPPVSIANSTISGNSALCAGGGIHNAYSPLRLSNVTITGNTADTDNSGSIDCQGGGVYLGLLTLDVQNSVIAENVSLNPTYTAGADCYNSGGGVGSGGFNVIGDASACAFAGTGDMTGTTASPIDPLLLPLAWNGGTTPTHALLFSSSATDHGNPTACTWDHDAEDTTAEVTLTGDQRTVLRPYGTRCDAGSYEWSHCDDGVQNNGETGVDCGGGCATCDCSGTDAVMLTGSYSSVQTAYAAALDGVVIKARETNTGEYLDFGRIMYVTLRGGHDCDFFRIRGMTTVAGLTVAAGRLTVENVTIGP